MTNSRRKGKTGELDLAQFFRDHGIAARRSQQFKGTGESQDLTHDLPGVHVECKRTERFRLYDALEQATDEAAKGDIPTVFHRANGKPWVVIVDAADFLSLMRALNQKASTDPASAAEARSA